MIKKVISGGQQGADFAGLMAALALGLETGGTAPKGWKIQLPDGTTSSNPSLADYGLVQDTSSSYQPRTKKNVADSDGTVWFGYTESPGGKLTLGTAKQLNKPYIVNPTPEALRAWCEENTIEVLNVAGNRASRFNANIFQYTYDSIIKAFQNDQ